MILLLRTNVRPATATDIGNDYSWGVARDSRVPPWLTACRQNLTGNYNIDAVCNCSCAAARADARRESLDYVRRPNAR